MSEPVSNPESKPPVESGYRLLRALLRIWFALFFRKIRLLEEGFPATGAAVLVINHPAGLLDALILVAAFERQLHCVIEEKLVQGPVRGFLAQGLGMVPYGADEKGWRSAAESCYRLLSRESAVVVFAEPTTTKAAEPSRLAVNVANLVFEAESGQLGPITVFPVHLLLPVSPSRSTELLIYVDAPLVTRDHTWKGEGVSSDLALPLAAALDKVCQHNAFRLQPESFEQFLSDLEEVLERDLAEEWSGRPNWKQTVEGFQLSRLIGAAADQMNNLHPGRLLALWELLDAYRESLRVRSLRQLETEASGWLKSSLPRAVTWLEVLLGAPVAAYGLLNHAVVLLLLGTTGLLKRRATRSLALEWTARGLIVLSCYVGQIALCAHLLGRAAAGYYAVSLPISAVYIWRYSWLLRHRGRLAYFAASLPAQAAKVRRFRKQLLMELNAARDKFGVMTAFRAQ